MRDSIRSTTSFFHTSKVVHPGLDDHLRIPKFIHKGIISRMQNLEAISPSLLCVGVVFLIFGCPFDWENQMCPPIQVPMVLLRSLLFIGTVRLVGAA